MATTKLLSLCCAALPLGGVVNERFGHRTGHCSHCGGHTTFGPGGTLEGQPRFILPCLSAEEQLTRIERRLALRDLLGCVGGLLCGALILLTIFYASWWLGERERRERGREGIAQKQIGGTGLGAHAPTVTGQPPNTSKLDMPSR